MSNGKVEHVTKLEAAERQLRTAIKLFFESGDPISIATLSAAAQGILRDLAQVRGMGSLLHDNPLVREERRSEWINILNRSQNFFKHADRDPDEALEFRHEFVRLQLLDAAVLHRELTGKFVRESLVYVAWFNLSYPELLRDQQLQDYVAKWRAQGVHPEDFEFVRLLLSEVMIPDPR